MQRRIFPLSIVSVDRVITICLQNKKVQPSCEAKEIYVKIQRTDWNQKMKWSMTIRSAKREQFRWKKKVINNWIIARADNITFKRETHWNLVSGYFVWKIELIKVVNGNSIRNLSALEKQIVENCWMNIRLRQDIGEFVLVKNVMRWNQLQEKSYWNYGLWCLTCKSWTKCIFLEMKWNGKM